MPISLRTPVVCAIPIRRRLRRVRRSVTAHAETARGGTEQHRAGPREQRRRGGIDCIVRARAARYPSVQSMPDAGHRPVDHSLLQRRAKLHSNQPVSPRQATTRIAWPLLLEEMLYSGFARAEEPAQFFMYHGGVAVSSAACTLGVAERAPGIKRGTGRANAVILCAWVRIRLASRRARRG
jgi:hypothetical protein